MTRKSAARVVLGAVALLAVAAVAAAAPVQDALAEVRRLRDAGDFAAAVRLLDEHLVLRPDDGEAARLLAETLYWLGDRQRAREVYEAALVRHPENTALRLNYARMLAETGEPARARTLLEQLRRLPAARADAETLLGVLAYWDGDLTGARRLFAAALEIDPQQAEARRLLQEIDTAAAPWVQVSPGAWHDNQSLDRAGIELRGGWYPTPLLPLAVRVESLRYRLPDADAVTLQRAEMTMAHYAPRARVETEFAVGLLKRDTGTTWTGQAAVGVRLPRHVTARGHVQRGVYLHTTSSLMTPVVTRTVGGRLRWDDPRGWLAEAVVEVQRYPDRNSVRTAYAWLLAPLATRETVTLQAGYAAAFDDADESRFVLARPVQPFPPGDPRFSTEGRYVPYYTPSRVVTHQAVGALVARAARGVTLRVGGALPLYATENAPTLVVTGRQPERVFSHRTFRPWNARASLEVRLSGSLTLQATGEAGRTAFYHWQTASAHLIYRFLPGAGGSGR